MENNSYIIADISIDAIYIFLPLILGLLHARRAAHKNQRNDILLLYYLVISVGIQGLHSGFWQAFNPQLGEQY